FSLWLNWYAARSRQSRGAGTARACSVLRAASDAARAARLRDRALPARERISDFLAHRARAERAADARRKPRKTANLAHDAVAQGGRLAAPAQRFRHIEQRQLRHAEFPLVGIVAGAEIEVAHPVRMERLHGAFDHQQTGRAARPFFSG